MKVSGVRMMRISFPWSMYCCMRLRRPIPCLDTWLRSWMLLETDTPSSLIPICIFSGDDPVLMLCLRAFSTSIWMLVGMTWRTGPDEVSVTDTCSVSLKLHSSDFIRDINQTGYLQARESPPCDIEAAGSHQAGAASCPVEQSGKLQSVCLSGNYASRPRNSKIPFIFG